MTDKIISLNEYIEHKEEEDEYKIPELHYTTVVMTEDLKFRETARQYRAKLGIKNAESDGEIIE